MSNYFVPETGAFVDSRRLSPDDPNYARFYHRLENWDAAQIWKSANVLQEMEARYKGVNAAGNPVPKDFFWIDDLKRHEQLLGTHIDKLPIKKQQMDSKGVVQTVDVGVLDVQRMIQDHHNSCRAQIQTEFSGTNINAAFEAVYTAMMFGRHIYIEGSSGTGKTAIIRAMCGFLGLPYEQFDAYADATDLNLLGGEVPQTDGKGGITFNFERGPLLAPGIINLVIDELPRLPAATSNVLLQAMSERKVSVSLVASGSGSSTFLLSPGFCVIGTGNPTGYGGQGERSLALFDRFDIGVEMAHPGIAARQEIVARAATGGQQSSKRALISPQFTLYEARAALDAVQLPEALIPIFLMAAHSISPQGFLDRTRSEDPFLMSTQHANSGAPAERPVWAAAMHFKEVHKRKYADLRAMANDCLVEGSNPRGEISAIKNSQAWTLIHWRPQWTKRQQPLPPTVTLEALRKGFHWANLSRLKTFPGSEDQKAPLLDAAVDLFFDKEKWQEAFNGLKDPNAKILPDELLLGPRG